MASIVSRLGLNEMPFTPHKMIIESAQQALIEANRYPEFDSRTLRTVLANHYDVSMDWIAVGNGSAGIIHQAMIASGQKEVAFGWPSFDAFPYMAKGLGMSVRYIKLANHACDLEDMARSITRQTSIVIICTPNTPTGGVVSHQSVVKFLDKAHRDLVVLIDEAYQEFVTDASAVRSLELVKKYPNVVVTRTFSKAYGLAGLRIGYAVAQPALTEKIIAAGVPFTIPVPVQAAAIKALSQSHRLKKQVASINKERQHMVARLQALHAPAVDGHGNFVWLPVGTVAEQIADILSKQGVLVKTVQSFGLRVTVGTRQETEHLLKAWKKVRHLLAAAPEA